MLETNVSPPRNGTQPPPSSVQTNVPITDQTLVETLLIQPTTDNTLLAGRELLLDVSLVQETWNSTKKKMLVSSKENSSLSHPENVNLVTKKFKEKWKKTFLSNKTLYILQLSRKHKTFIETVLVLYNVPINVFKTDFVRYGCLEYVSRTPCVSWDIEIF